MVRSLNVNLESFGPKNETRAQGIKATLESTFDAFIAEFGTEPDAAVNVAWWSHPQPPKALFDHRPYEIRINAVANNWPQYAYQFAHELCHVMTNFDRIKRHRHKWFEESLCELASLRVLCRLANVWAATPPLAINESRHLAQDHANYARQVKYSYSLPPGVDLPGWLATNIERMEESSTKRELNGPLAVALAKSFRQDSALWRDCTALNYWDANNDGTFREYLDSWEARLRESDAEPGRMPALARALFLRDEAEAASNTR
ncbi:MAG: hypothetical protein OXI87_18980 [Albidovulum sp.]|nr:hypothetical protein [Albidovulum sp.]